MTDLAPPSAAADASAAAVTFDCPACAAELAAADGRTRCPNCGWRGEAYGFRPRAVAVDAAEAALPEDAACLHHPTKRAAAVCAGTGDYICSLCAVDLNGRTYSAAYLDAGGKQVAKRAFDRSLPRPDTTVYLYLILCFVPGVNYLMLPLAFVWIPHAFFLYAKARRMRRENPLFARVMGRSSVYVIPVLLTLASLLWVAGVIAVVYMVLENNPRGRF